MPKAFIRQFIVPEIDPYSSVSVLINGKRFEDSEFKQYTPFLGMSVSNNSDSDISVCVNGADTNAFPVPARTSRSLSGIPIWDVLIINESITPITMGELRVTVINDIKSCLEYNEYMKKNIF